MVHLAQRAHKVSFLIWKAELVKSPLRCFSDKENFQLCSSTIWPVDLHWFALVCNGCSGFSVLHWLHWFALVALVCVGGIGLPWLHRFCVHTVVQSYRYTEILRLCRNPTTTQKT